MKEFNFVVYNRRHSCDLTYKVTKKDEGWHISANAINGDCEPDGTHYFYSNFDQDNISYPKEFGTFLTRLWKEIGRFKRKWGRNSSTQQL